MPPDGRDSPAGDQHSAICYRRTGYRQNQASAEEHRAPYNPASCRERFVLETTL